MRQKLLLNAGLTQVQAEIYDFLLENIDIKASEIAKKIKRPRGVVYKGLDELIALGLAEKKETGKITLFRADHPSKLEAIFTAKEKNIAKEKQDLIGALPDFISAFNLTHNKPGVKYYEGEEGVWRVLQDTLTSKTEILSIVDIEAVDKYIKELNSKYVNERNKIGIKKRLIAVDSTYAREHFTAPGGYTDVKLMTTTINPFNTSIHIYDNKIAYITMTDTYLTGMIINDQNIFSMQKALFEQIWKNN